MLCLVRTGLEAADWRQRQDAVRRTVKLVVEDTSPFSLTLQTGYPRELQVGPEAADLLAEERHADQERLHDPGPGRADLHHDAHGVPAKSRLQRAPGRSAPRAAAALLRVRELRGKPAELGRRNKTYTTCAYIKNVVFESSRKPKHVFRFSECPAGFSDLIRISRKIAEQIFCHPMFIRFCFST